MSETTLASPDATALLGQLVEQQRRTADAIFSLKNAVVTELHAVHLAIAGSPAEHGPAAAEAPAAAQLEHGADGGLAAELGADDGQVHFDPPPAPAQEAPADRG